MSDSSEPIPQPYWHTRGYLPHFESHSHLQAVSFHLGDSLPQAVTAKMARDSRRIVEDAAYRERIAQYIDSGYGACWLARPAAAAILRDCLHCRNGEQYELHAYTIMPNHLHVIVQVLSPATLAKVVQGWKTFSARRINQWLNRKGKVWHQEYWDRFIRSEQHLADAIEYVLQNPVKARLVQRPQDWPWTWLSERYRDWGEEEEHQE